MKSIAICSNHSTIRRSLFDPVQWSERRNKAIRIPSNYQNKIEMVQRRAARFVCNNYSREASVTAMLDELGWRSLKQRRTDQRYAL